MLTTWEWIISILLMVVAIVMIIIVLFQQSDDDGLSSAIGGSSSAYDSYLGKNESRTTSAKLAKFTKMLAAVFFVFVMVLDIIINVREQFFVGSYARQFALFRIFFFIRESFKQEGFLC